MAPRFPAVVNQCIAVRRAMLQWDKPRTLTDQEVDQFVIEELERLASAQVESRMSDREPKSDRRQATGGGERAADTG